MRRQASAALLILSFLGGGGTLSEHRGRDRGDDRSTHSDGKCKNADSCQDNDFSPDLQDSPVVICLPNSTCNFGPGNSQQAIAVDPACPPIPYPHCDPYPTALVPPNPEKLVTAIQAGAAGIGKAAGELAGAIAALPPAILL